MRRGSPGSRVKALHYPSRELTSAAIQEAAGGRISIIYVALDDLLLRSSKSRDKTNSHRSHGGKRNVSVCLLMSLAPLAYSWQRHPRRISPCKSGKQYAISHKKIPRMGNFQFMENRSTPTCVCASAHEGNVAELTDQRVTTATFLSVRTQTNARAKAIRHAVPHDIWEAGSGGGGGKGGSTICRAQTSVRLDCA